MNNNIEIKPCPFCGGFSKLVPKSKTYVGGELTYNCYVECKECHCRSGRFLLSEYETHAIARQKAIESWNKRVGESR